MHVRFQADSRINRGICRTGLQRRTDRQHVLFEKMAPRKNFRQVYNKVDRRPAVYGLGMWTTSDSVDIVLFSFLYRLMVSLQTRQQ
jgi:hypothetical protein